MLLLNYSAHRWLYPLLHLFFVVYLNTIDWNTTPIHKRVYIYIIHINLPLSQRTDWTIFKDLWNKSEFMKKAEHRRIDAYKLWCWRRLESPLDCEEIQPVHPKGDQSLIFIGRTDAEAETPILWLRCKELTHWKRPWCWERLKSGREGDDRGSHGSMASPSRWTWVWASSENWWCTGKPGMLQSVGLQRIRHDWVIEMTENKSEFMSKISFLTPLCLRLGIITTKWHSTNSNVSALYLTSKTFQIVNLNTFRWGQNFPTHHRPLSVLSQAGQLHWFALLFWTMKLFHLPSSKQLPWIKQI